MKGDTDMNIVITGTHKGLGKAIAEYYLMKGNTVFGCSRNASSIEHDLYHHFVADVSEEKDVIEFGRFVRQNTKTIDGLINNAGVSSMNHFLLTPVETAKRLMNINYFGTFLCIREFVPLLRKSGHGRIVNFSTQAVPLRLAGEMAYGASKSAVESLTKVLAKELAGFKITVNAVGPPPIKTDLTAKVPQEKMDRLLESMAIPRFGEPRDVINVINFFLNEESDLVTGQVVYLGGVID